MVAHQHLAPRPAQHRPRRVVAPPPALLLLRGGQPHARGVVARVAQQVEAQVEELIGVLREPRERRRAGLVRGRDRGGQGVELDELVHRVGGEPRGAADAHEVVGLPADAPQRIGEVRDADPGDDLDVDEREAVIFQQVHRHAVGEHDPFGGRRVEVQRRHLESGELRPGIRWLLRDGRAAGGDQRAQRENSDRGAHQLVPPVAGLAGRTRVATVRLLLSK